MHLLVEMYFHCDFLECLTGTRNLRDEDSITSLTKRAGMEEGELPSQSFQFLVDFVVVNLQYIHRVIKCIWVVSN